MYISLRSSRGKYAIERLWESLLQYNSFYLSFEIAVNQWITSCHKNRMATRVITLWRVHVKSLTTSVSAMRFRIEIMIITKANAF